MERDSIPALRLAGAALLLAWMGAGEAGAMDREGRIPPIDRERPARVETATFAAG